jgi:hypothetical protein
MLKTPRWRTRLIGTVSRDIAAIRRPAAIASSTKYNHRLRAVQGSSARDDRDSLDPRQHDAFRKETRVGGVRYQTLINEGLTRKRAESAIAAPLSGTYSGPQPQRTCCETHPRQSGTSARLRSARTSIVTRRPDVDARTALAFSPSIDCQRCPRRNRGLGGALFVAAYDRHKERACSERDMTGTTDGSHWLRASIDRVAISHALIERGYLLVQSRRVTPPITLRSASRIT